MRTMTSLHLIDPKWATEFVAALQSGSDAPLPGLSEQSSRRWRESANQGLARAGSGREAGANQFTSAFAVWLSGRSAVVLAPDSSLTTWEARVDRGIGMLMRPPSRLFVEAGLPQKVVHSLPIRLDANMGMMGGAFIPPRLMPALLELLDSRLERMIRRLTEADMDPAAIYSAMFTAATLARERGHGLYEAQDIALEGMLPASASIVLPNPMSLDAALRERIVIAARPSEKERKPGLVGKLLGRRAPSPNGEDQ